jgi:Phage capsid protein
MAVTIDRAAQKTFENNVRHTAQQIESALRRLCVEKSGPTASHSFKITGTRSLSNVAKTRRQATPINDQVWANRVAIPAPFDDGEAIDGEDVAKMVIDPTSTVVTSMGYAVKRKYDDIIIGAITANALDEEQHVNVFPAAQYFDGSGSYTDRISLKTLTGIRNKFSRNEVPDEEEKFMVLGPNQIEQLLHETKIGSADYNTIKPLENGKLVRFAGLSLVPSNRLLHPNGAGSIDCPVFTRKAFGLLVIEDLFARVAEDPSLSFATRAYVRINAGAVRIQDEQVVVARLNDTVSIA